MGQHFCNMCDIQYTTRRKFYDHNIYKHGKQSVCNKCDKSFASKKKLDSHVVHDKVIKVRCIQCGKGFVRGADIKRHMVTCGVKISNKPHRKATVSDPYCKHCDKHYLDNSGLETHMKTRHQSFNQAKVSQ